MGQALRLSEAQHKELLAHAAGLRGQAGLLQRISRLPGRLVRGGGGENRQPNGGASASTGTPRDSDGKVSIAKDWVHFLMDEEAQPGHEAGGNGTIPSGAPASLDATPQAAESAHSAIRDAASVAEDT